MISMRTSEEWASPLLYIDCCSVWIDFMLINCVNIIFQAFHRFTVVVRFYAGNFILNLLFSTVLWQHMINETVPLYKLIFWGIHFHHHKYNENSEKKNFRSRSIESQFGLFISIFKLYAHYIFDSMLRSEFESHFKMNLKWLQIIDRKK